MKTAFTMTAPIETYRRRRARLADGLERPLVVFAGYARARNHAGLDYPYRAGSTYLYLGGPPIEGAAWLIEPGSDGQSGSTLIRPESGPDDAIWIGPSPSDDEIAAAAGVEAGKLASPDDLERLLSGRRAGAIIPPCPRTIEWAGALNLDRPEDDELRLIIDMRNIKDEHEVAAMRRAAKVGGLAHLAAMRATQPGASEAVVAAAFESAIVANGCVASFTAIMTVDGEILHRLGYAGTLRAGRLLLGDGGAAEPSGYASDATRVWPVDGAFTPVQRDLYNVVLTAERAGVAACVPGARYRDIHDLAALKICEGLVETGFLRGDPASLLERRAHTPFFPHGVGHLIGLDVHDMEDFGDLAGYPAGRTRREGLGDKFLRLDRDLEPGMTVTIEPGIYFVPAIWQRDDLVGKFADCVDRAKVDALLEAGFGGIRLEDDILVRAEGGPENLTQDLPIEANDVLKAMRGEHCSALTT